MNLINNNLKIYPLNPILDLIFNIKNLFIIIKMGIGDWGLGVGGWGVGGQPPAPTPPNPPPNPPKYII